MITLILSTFLIASGNIRANSFSASDEIAKATKAGKAVFLVITGTGVTDVAKAEKIAKDASLKVKNSVVVKMNKDEAANAAIVTKYGIAGVTAPFLLVISPKGVATGGFDPAQATADQLVKAIPSPKQDEALWALNEKRPVFIIVSKTGLTDKKTILTDCKTASSKITSKPVVIEIDVDDAKESAFLKQIGVPTLNGKTKVVVANGSGQITATYEGAVNATDLTTSANKTVKAGGCCPGGASKSGCGKK